MSSVAVSLTFAVSAQSGKRRREKKKRDLRFGNGYTPSQNARSRFCLHHPASILFPFQISVPKWESHEKIPRVSSTIQYPEKPSKSVGQTL
jgi:hypothetical protein